MTEVVVRARALTKRFQVLRRQRTVLRVLRALADPSSLRKELLALDDVSFEVAAGEKLALVGRNGSGKTTLLRILAGIYERTSGELWMATEPRPLFSHSIGFAGELPLESNIFLYGAMHGMDRRYLRPRTDAILDLAGLQELRFALLKELSAGQRQRLALSVFFQAPSPFLVFDEALTNVDRGFLLHCERWFDSLAASNRTVVMTGHDSQWLRRHCRTALWLDGGRLRMHGPAPEVLDAYDRSFAP
jgi:ABC-type polysaccharide/polyol phosphate transport system ATPase subunit